MAREGTGGWFVFADSADDDLNWVAFTRYVKGQLVINAGQTYIARDAHDAGASFSGDAAAHWIALVATGGGGGGPTDGVAEYWGDYSGVEPTASWTPDLSTLAIRDGAVDTIGLTPTAAADELPACLLIPDGGWQWWAYVTVFFKTTAPPASGDLVWVAAQDAVPYESGGWHPLIDSSGDSPTEQAVGVTLFGPAGDHADSIAVPAVFTLLATEIQPIAIHIAVMGQQSANYTQHFEYTID